MVGKSGTRRRAPKSMADAMPTMDRAGTQGWRRSRQVAMPASRGSDSKASQLVILTKLLLRISILVAANLSPSRERSEGLDHARS
ncbi:hypothetical protein KU43_00525 [Mesotoga sp. SC_NapDC2]|nr:hypothetical protein RJ60_00635 [Mesotoga sp. B105.6.4]PXF34731.1 hypothetical protein EU77_05880 [Mesotoga sp. SC_NapDC]RIZ61784.1 hypothetical protein KU43_00525 [Mesotoga sp. SC_NapDC2]